MTVSMQLDMSLQASTGLRLFFARKCGHRDLATSKFLGNLGETQLHWRPEHSSCCVWHCVSIWSQEIVLCFMGYYGIREILLLRGTILRLGVTRALSPGDDSDIFRSIHSGVCQTIGLCQISPMRSSAALCTDHLSKNFEARKKRCGRLEDGDGWSMRVPNGAHVAKSRSTTSYTKHKLRTNHIPTIHHMMLVEGWYGVREGKVDRLSLVWVRKVVWGSSYQIE